MNSTIPGGMVGEDGGEEDDLSMLGRLSTVYGAGTANLGWFKLFKGAAPAKSENPKSVFSILKTVFGIQSLSWFFTLFCSFTKITVGLKCLASSSLIEA